MVTRQLSSRLWQSTIPRLGCSMSVLMTARSQQMRFSLLWYVLHLIIIRQRSSAVSAIIIDLFIATIYHTCSSVYNPIKLFEEHSTTISGVRSVTMAFHLQEPGRSFYLTKWRIRSQSLRTDDTSKFPLDWTDSPTSWQSSLKKRS